MSVMRKIIAPVMGLALAMLFSACGISSYPGQPGIVTNGYSKIDLENLDFDGLWVYEAVYDNTEGGKGVGAILTKLYPGAQTYTTNVRTNGEGTLYRHKGQLNGAELQMLSIPSLNQIHLPPNSKVGLLLEYIESLDEIDDKNTAEMDLFKPSTYKKAARHLEKKWKLIKLGQFSGRGLAYEVSAVKLGDKKFTPSSPILVETSLSQNGVRTTLSPEMREELIQFVERNYPKGFKGKAEFVFRGTNETLSVGLGLHSLKTAEAAGIKIIRDVSEQRMSELVNRYSKGTL